MDERTIDQFGGSPDSTGRQASGVKLEPLGILGVKGQTVAVAGSHVVRDRSKMICAIVRY